MRPTRRELLQTTALLGVAGAAMAAGVGTSETAAGEPAHAAEGLAVPATVKRGDMLYRTLGRTGAQVSLVGLGGHHIGRPPDEAEGIRIIRTRSTTASPSWTTAGTTTTAAANSAWARRCATATATKVFLMTKIDGRTNARPPQADRRVAATAADRSHRPDAAPRDHPPGGSGPDLRRRRRSEAMLEARSRPARSASSASPATRIRTIHLRMLEVAKRARLPFRRGPDAAQRDGRALPQLRAAGRAGARRGGHRRARA